MFAKMCMSGLQHTETPTWNTFTLGHRARWGHRAVQERGGPGEGARYLVCCCFFPACFPLFCLILVSFPPYVALFWGLSRLRWPSSGVFPAFSAFSWSLLVVPPTALFAPWNHVVDPGGRQAFWPSFRELYCLWRQIGRAPLRRTEGGNALDLSVSRKLVVHQDRAHSATALMRFIARGRASGHGSRRASCHQTHWWPR